MCESRSYALRRGTILAQKSPCCCSIFEMVKAMLKQYMLLSRSKHCKKATLEGSKNALKRTHCSLPALNKPADTSEHYNIMFRGISRLYQMTFLSYYL